jgi:hypothetical protein
MRLILFNILSMLCFWSLCQEPVNVPESGCEPVGISTNPDDYQNPYDPQATKKWDWRTQDYTMYLTNTSGTPGTPVTIVNPFYDQSGNPNTFFLADAFDKDFKWEDGWELLYKKFGTESQGVITPYFMLYNKYSGVVRVFVNIINSGTFSYTAGGIQLTMEKPNPSPPGLPTVRQTAVLNHLGTYTFASDQLQKNAGHFSANYYENSGVNNNYYWLYADFTTLYDACTCGLVGDWYFYAGLVNNLQINVEINGTLTTVVDANPSNPSQSTVGGFWGEINDYISFGSGVINNISGIVKSGNKGFKDGVELLNAGQTLANNSSVVIGNNKAKNLAPILFKIFVQAPRINMLLNLASSVITTVKKVGDDYDKLTNDNPKDANALKQPKVTETGLKATANGEITVDAPYVLNALRIPGSKTASGQGAIDFRNPVYDEILGVWNLFKQPKFDIIQYRPNNPLVGYHTGMSDPSDPYAPYEVTNNEYPVFPNIYQLKLTNTPEILLNPASGLEVVDIDYQIVFENYDSPTDYQLQGIMFPGAFEYHADVAGTFGAFYRNSFYETSFQNRENYTEAMGFELALRNNSWDTSQITTPYLGQNCISDYPIFSYSEISKPVLKVKVVLDPINNDPNSDVDQVIFTHTFPGVIKDSTSQTGYTILGTPNLSKSDPNFEPVSVNLPIDLTNYITGYNGNSILKDELIDQDFTVIGDMYVAENVTFAPGPHVIQATGEIFIEKPLTNVGPNSNVVFQSAKNIFVKPECEIDPEVVLEINPSVVLPCNDALDTFPEPSEIAEFCNSSVYSDRSKPENNNLKPELEEISNLPIFKNELGGVDFLIYPNPAYDRADVKIVGDGTLENIVIKDMSGRQVPFNSSLNSNGMSLELNSLESGMYQVQIVFSNGVAVTKQLSIVK